MAETAVVTGATGYLASTLVIQLLQKGVDVRGTCRDKASDKTRPLVTLAEALPGTLTLYDADLLQPGAFDEVTTGADVVYHTASPFLRNITDPQKDLIQPAVRGTTNVLQSAAKSGVRRVIVTSSLAACLKMKTGPANGKVYTEDDWNTEVTVETGAYFLSKVLAEKEAWRLSKELGLDIVVINPGYILGPIAAGKRADGISVSEFKGLLEGTINSLPPIVVDVRDVARAQILAAETPAASGRYLIANSSTTSAGAIVEIMQRRFANQLEFTSLPIAPSKQLVDTSKAKKDLDFEVRALRETVVDMAVTLMQTGIAKPKLAATRGSSQ